jgi:hypothetical protein
MKNNVGKTDMIVRLVLAAVFVALYFLLDNKVVELILIILAIILAVTAVTHTCPLWYIFRVNTGEKKE